ncbi:hypothetical protein hairong_028 [Pseudomonas phage hairong]|nr:hypothetical protein hairong_028 [Pseudomonas phage hairong]
MAFDTTKNYAEFGNAFFRGRLKGATGVARFKLTAGSVNAVDTINIAGRAVTYDWIVQFGPATAQPGEVLYQTVIDIVDDDVYIEFLAYSDTKTTLLDGSVQPLGMNRTFWIDGVMQPNFVARDPGFKICPYNSVVPLARGQHVIQIRAYQQSNGQLTSPYSAEGYIFCRYIRRTGSDA